MTVFQKIESGKGGRRRKKTRKKSVPSVRQLTDETERLKKC
jgi:hypothetical protein